MSVQSLDRAFDILELLAEEQQPLSLSKICTAVGLHKTTTHRILDSLKERGYVEKDENTAYYRLGLGFIEISSLYLNKIELKTEADPYLQLLSQELGRTVYLAIMQDYEVAYIGKFEQFNSLRKYSIIGRRKPVYSTSLGKSLLFDKNDEEIREILQKVEMTQYTETTITDPEEFIKEIDESRHRGYSRDNSEMIVGEQCVGAPIYDYRNHVIAAISVAWNGDFTPFDGEKVAALVQETAAQISRRLGYLGSRSTNGRRNGVELARSLV